ncbi:hypothetical protein AB0M29_11025 [Streptomyces sp. NPDC051976]
MLGALPLPVLSATACAAPVTDKTTRVKGWVSGTDVYRDVGVSLD